MRVVFLDIDGVLNSRRWMALRGRKEVGASTAAAHSLDPSAVGLLNELVVRAHADVVISSTWRHGGLFHVTASLVARGFIGHVAGMTPETGEHLRTRGDEIRAWLDDWSVGHEAPLESFVILDDDDDMGALARHLVQTSFAEGLQREHVERAVAHLEETSTWK